MHDVWCHIGILSYWLLMSSVWRWCLDINDLSRVCVLVGPEVGKLRPANTFYPAPKFCRKLRKTKNSDREKFSSFYSRGTAISLTIPVLSFIITRPRPMCVITLPFCPTSPERFCTWSIRRSEFLSSIQLRLPSKQMKEQNYGTFLPSSCKLSQQSLQKNILVFSCQIWKKSSRDDLRIFNQLRLNLLCLLYRSHLTLTIIVPSTGFKWPTKWVFSKSSSRIRPDNILFLLRKEKF
jgi:hypothetical protein